MSVVFYLLLLILPMSALVARRLPMGRFAWLALIWLAIFVTLFVVVSALSR